jgi:carboxyl-terminal processing protease
MLSRLDPYSAFLNRDQFKELQEQSRGRALGFGSILYVSPGKVMVLQAAQNSPAGRAGLGPGDEIVEVNGQRIAHLDFPSLIQLLEQSRSHSVRLEVLHPGKLVPETFKLNPAEVPLPSVDKAFLYSPGIGYIHLKSFEQKTPQEVLDAVKRLGGPRPATAGGGGAGLKGLLFDLRDNHGGLVDSAVSTVSLFLKPRLLLLTVRGRSVPEKSYWSVETPRRFEMPVIVLVNGNTASAAEVVAADLQEHDRALVAGEPTFGKGVVESVIPLGDDAGLALTTAQYFTPSGRSIQRPLAGTLLAAPQTSLGNALGTWPTDFHTDDGRPLQAQGGIIPDRAFPSWNPDPWASFLDERGIFTTFASDYLTRHGRVQRDFLADDSTLEDFHAFLERGGIRAPDQYWQRDQDYLKLRIRVELFSLVFGLSVGDEVQTLGDPQVREAARLFPDVDKLLARPADHGDARQRN